MKKKQNGFNAVVLLFVLLVLGLISIGGWYVWSANKKKDSANTTAVSIKSQSKESTNNTGEEYVVPANYQVYENKDLEFKFAYPKSWGPVQNVASESVARSAILNQANIDSEGDVKGGMWVFSEKPQDFRVTTGYKGATVRPISNNGEIEWRISATGDDALRYTDGDIYTPTPKVLYDKEGVKVFEFNQGHASSAWTILVFETKGRYVGLHSPLFNPAHDVDQYTYDQKINEFQSTLLEISSSVRLL